MISPLVNLLIDLPPIVPLVTLLPNSLLFTFLVVVIVTKTNPPLQTPIAQHHQLPPPYQQQHYHRPWFNLTNYSKFFNVTTDEVKQRLWAVFTIHNTFIDDLAGRLDAYGLVWISITLAVAIFAVTSSTRGPAALTSSLLYILCYLTIVGGGGWMTLRWMGAETVYLMEFLCLLGYSLAPALVIPFIYFLGFSWLVWVSAIMISASSALFMWRNIKPILNNSSMGSDKGSFYSLILAIIQVTFILSLKIFFL